MKTSITSKRTHLWILIKSTYWFVSAYIDTPNWDDFLYMFVTGIMRTSIKSKRKHTFINFNLKRTYWFVNANIVEQGRKWLKSIGIEPVWVKTIIGVPRLLAMLVAWNANIALMCPWETSPQSPVCRKQERKMNTTSEHQVDLLETWVLVDRKVITW